MPSFGVFAAICALALGGGMSVSHAQEATAQSAQESTAQSAQESTAQSAQRDGEGGPSFAPGQVIEVPSPILTLDWEELYARSAWGLRVAAEIETASANLTRENTRIADDLVVEERNLTTRRATMAIEAFRKEADAFDGRVVGIRRAQEAKARALAAQAEAERTQFINQAVGLLDAMIEARGAVVVIDRRAIIRGAGAVDVTADMVARADAAFGDGADAGVTDQAPIEPAAPTDAPIDAPTATPVSPMPVPPTSEADAAVTAAPAAPETGTPETGTPETGLSAADAPVDMLAQPTPNPKPVPAPKP